ncbi:MAG: pyruvate dehydrogenase (acetyl-transferring), homodimeric type [Desulfuromonadales bacterium]|nr:pyruvate dehydrogenase (acetyl-transferring), homodimeric type [Desulfuromonadales bacterium]MBN2791024.1 pyruvate dehydrogenase (acetyl-transferring), homodimeric type [Desulfuromonadales bacterium]
MTQIPLHHLAEEELQDWLDALDGLSREKGDEGVREILRQLQSHAMSKGVQLNEATLNTPYVNSIHWTRQPAYPGDLELEKKIENIIRWNAMAMVLQANDAGTGVGGHIATYASAATQMEVGFHHIFRAPGENYGGDLLIVQPHASPGVYARAFLEGSLSEQQLKNFRRELEPGGGLSSYPHPRNMPDFWQVPCSSMGLGTPTAIYQARFMKYLENRGLKPDNGGRVWCFVGDGETDEPEVRGTINMASRENLDNLVLVVNCNLQRLDGPVRGNGKIIQELERSFRGADWNVIKVIWGEGWDGLLDHDTTGALHRRMEEALDGDYQMYSVSSGDTQRELWVENNPVLRDMMSSLSDEEVRAIKRGGQDPKKIYAAYHQACQSPQKPTVILIKTVKGDSLGAAAQGRNTSHQKKQFSLEERLDCAERWGIPLSKEDIGRAQFYRPAEDSAEIRYLRQKREQLNGFLPRRNIRCPELKAPKISLFSEFIQPTAEREASTTISFVRMLSRLLKDQELGRYIVPIVPDEARTFGMDGLFKEVGIYSCVGQQYQPVDAGSLLPYREAKDGQILQEGICETGAMASFLAAGTAYAVHGIPTIPFYVFYSMFGFQRVGDMIWACADMLCRGFLFGGTAGRTTLNGEGLQHQDGHSHVLATTFPNLRSYDPAYAYELAVILRDGIERMYHHQENVFYYITLYNESYPQPAMPKVKNLEQQIIKGAYCLKEAEPQAEQKHAIHLLASGVMIQQALRAVDLLAGYGLAAHVWSVTSYSELYRNAIECERHNRLNPDQEQLIPYLQDTFNHPDDIFVAVSDYLKALPNSIRAWIPGPMTVLGTDGFGLSDSRESLRSFFEVSAEQIAFAALELRYRQGLLSQKELLSIRAKLGIDPHKQDAAAR